MADCEDILEGAETERAERTVRDGMSEVQRGRNDPIERSLYGGLRVYLYNNVA